jgi:hypothetical protein
MVTALGEVAPPIVGGAGAIGDPQMTPLVAVMRAWQRGNDTIGLCHFGV